MARQAVEWTWLTATERATVKAQYAAAGIKLIVSLFGATDAPTSSGADPVATANTMAAWVKQFGLDGVDVDYEVSDRLFAGNTKTLNKISGFQCYQRWRWQSRGLSSSSYSHV